MKSYATWMPLFKIHSLSLSDVSLPVTMRPLGQSKIVHFLYPSKFFNFQGSNWGLKGHFFRWACSKWAFYMLSGAFDRASHIRKNNYFYLIGERRKAFTWKEHFEWKRLSRNLVTQCNDFAQKRTCIKALTFEVRKQIFLQKSKKFVWEIHAREEHLEEEQLAFKGA